MKNQILSFSRLCLAFNFVLFVIFPLFTVLLRTKLYLHIYADLFFSLHTCYTCLFPLCSVVCCSLSVALYYYIFLYLTSYITVIDVMEDSSRMPHSFPAGNISFFLYTNIFINVYFADSFLLTHL
jgi:hypothetical protein